MRTQRFTSPILLLASLLLPATLPAQTSTTGTVQGSVVYGGGDQEGQAAIGVVVNLVSVREGGETYSAVTDAEGFFKISGVQVGKYHLSAYEARYDSQIYEEVVQPGSLHEFTIELTPGKAQTVKVEVIGSRQGLETRETAAKTSISKEAIAQLPFTNTRVTDLMQLMPGVSVAGSSDSTNISVVGSRANEVGYRLDGVNFTDALFGGPAGGVSSMAIEQFQLIRGGFQAEYGQQSVGIANIITKSGSNEVEFQYALTWRDVGVYGSKQGELDRVQGIWNNLLNGTYFDIDGEISQGLGGPPSTRADDRNPPPRFRVQHQIGVGGPIKVDKVFFYTNLDVLTNDIPSAYDDNEDQQDVITYLAKVTWQISDRHKFWTEFNLERTKESGTIDPQIADIASTESTDGAWTLAFHDRYSFAGEGFFKDSFVESAFTLNHRYITDRPANADADRRVQILLPPAGAIFLGRDGPVANTDYTLNDYRLTGALTKPLKKHNLKIGGEVGYQTLDGTSERFPIYNDFRLAFAGQNFLSADLPPGSLGQFIDPGPPQHLSESAYLAGFYVQDLWTVTDNLTIEPGVRLDYQDFVDRIVIAPRLGASLDPAGNGRTLFQVSYGHFYQNLFLDALIHDLRPNQTINEVIAGDEATPETAGFDVISLDDLVEATRAFENGVKTLGRVIPIQTQIFDIDDRLTAPHNESWTARVQRQLPQNVVLDLSFTEANRYDAPTFTVDTVDNGASNPGIPLSVVRVLYSTDGLEKVQQWALGLTKNFSNGWQLQGSYTQGKVLGPIGSVGDPLDPLRVTQSFGVLGRDRTEVINLSASVDLPWKLRLAGTYRYATGLPITPQAFNFTVQNLSNDATNPVLVTRVNAVQPLGFNSMRLPPTRTLDLSLNRSFKFKGDNTLEGRLTVFNVTNEFNVYSGLALLGPLNDANPFDSPPLRPSILPLAVDIPRTVQLELRFSF